MKITINLTDDILALISNIHFQKVPDVTVEKYPMTWGIDFHNLYGGNFLFEDIAFIIGKYDQVIDGTQENPIGPQFPKELEQYMLDIHSYIVENIYWIEDLVHFYSNKGGLKAGTYTCKDYEKIWKYNNN